MRIKFTPLTIAAALAADPQTPPDAVIVDGLPEELGRHAGEVKGEGLPAGLGAVYGDPNAPIPGSAAGFPSTESAIARGSPNGATNARSWRGSTKTRWNGSHGMQSREGSTRAPRRGAHRRRRILQRFGRAPSSNGVTRTLVTWCWRPAEDG